MNGKYDVFDAQTPYSYPIPIISLGYRYDALSREVSIITRVTGPILPTSIVAIRTMSRARLMSPEAPVDIPFVPNADTTSNSRAAPTMYMDGNRDQDVARHAGEAPHGHRPHRVPVNVLLNRGRAAADHVDQGGGGGDEFQATQQHKSNNDRLARVRAELDGIHHDQAGHPWTPTPP